MAVDLFEALDGLFRHEPKGEGQEVPSPFILHRFLASDPDYAAAAKEIQRVSDPYMVYAIWRGAVRRSPRAPRLKYVGPRRSKTAEDLVARIMEVRSVRREVAEGYLDMLRQMKKLSVLEKEFGIEVKGFKDIKLKGNKKGKK